VPHMSKRQDIESLRALAVLAVILFHLDFAFIPGGFLGVDVFFVISGYLISRNILSDLGKGQFSFKGFYARRARRLLPALFATLIFTLLLSFLVFPPDHSFRLAIVAVLSVFSLSNFLFFSELGYFDTAAHMKPLLHTWSLAVEEQFYLIWPAFLALCFSARKRRVFWPGIYLVAVLSLLLAQAVQNVNPGAAFFLTPFRIFEFCIGALVVRFQRSPSPKRLNTAMLLLLGYAALLFSLVYFDDKTPMPGFVSLLPCIATALIIYAADDRFLGALRTNRAMVYTGAISYSLYLVHWPIIVFFKYQFGPELSLLVKGVLLLSFFVLASLMYRYIETPFRVNTRSGTMRSARGFAPIALAALLIFLVSGQAIYTQGWRFRLPEAINGIPSADAMWRERNAVTRVGECFLMKTQSFSEFNESVCLSVEPDRKNYLIFGDSFAADSYSVLSAAYPDVNFLQATAEACSPYPGAAQYETCGQLVDFIVSGFLPDERIDGVILSASWRYDQQPLLIKAIETLYAKTDKLIVVGSGIRFASSVPDLIVDSGASSKSDMEAYANQYIESSEREGNRLLKQSVEPLAPFIDYQRYQCPESCRIFTENGELAFIDYGHFTLSGSLELAGKIADEYRYLFEGDSGS
jgi:peptidoglycan/LPS O-acetylase OafA/YrhL